MEDKHRHFRSIARVREVTLLLAKRVEEQLDELAADLRKGALTPEMAARLLDQIKPSIVELIREGAEAEYLSQRRKIALGLLEKFKDSREDGMRNHTVQEVENLVDCGILEATVSPI